MQSFKFPFLSVICCCLLVGCAAESDEKYFDGDIAVVSHPEQIFELQPDTVFLDGAYYGFIASNDYIMVFWNARDDNFMFSVFDLRDGQFIGSFGRKGRGQNEFYDVFPISQIYEDNGYAKTVICAHTENKMAIWNITESVNSGTTVYDTVFPYQSTLSLSEIFMDKRSNSVYVYHMPYMPFENDSKFYESPFINKVDMNTGTITKRQLFKKKIEVEPTENVTADLTVRSHSAMKPDGTKMAMGMVFMPQLNILDFATDKQTGYRIGAGEEGFSRFSRKKDDYTYYCPAIQADDDFIYMAYFNDLYSNKDKRLDTIYVFDWDGNPVAELKLSTPISGFCVNQKENCIYTFNWKNTDILRFRLPNLK